MEAILAYLERQEYPEEYSKQQKRDLKKRAADFALNDGMLYYLGSWKKKFLKLHIKLFSTRKRNDGSFGKIKNAVFDEINLSDLLLFIFHSQYHEGSGNAHFGCDRTLGKIEECF